MSNLFEQLCRQSKTQQPAPPNSFFGLPPPPPDSTPGFIFRYHPDGYILPSPEALARLEAIKKLDEDSCCSFDEWKALGYWVKKGAKSYFKDCLGVPQFTKEQVNPPRR